MSMSPIRSALLTTIEDHLVATGQSADRFGRAFGDHKVVSRLRSKNLTLFRIENLMAFVAIQQAMIAAAADDDTEAA